MFSKKLTKLFYLDQSRKTLSSKRVSSHTSVCHSGQRAGIQKSNTENLDPASSMPSSYIGGAG